MDVTNPKNHTTETRFNWRRAVGLTFGLGAQLLFAFTAWRLFYFLRDGGPNFHGSFLVVDALLAAQFVILHSVLLYPTVRQQLTRWIHPAFYGCFFCIVTCLSLLAVICFWRADARFEFVLDGGLATVIHCGFYGSWIGLFYSLWLSGLGYQTGWTPWFRWVRRLPPRRREFRERGVYRLLRHPIYLSFLGLIWFTPHISGDRVLLCGIWTIYIFVGSYLKDERLAYFMGHTYREYQQRVPGYPLIGFGPLGRRKSLAKLSPADTDLSGKEFAPRRRAA